MQRQVPIEQLPVDRTRTLAVASLIVVACAAYGGSAKAQSLPSSNVAAIPTYEAVGLYWQSPGGSAGCEVKYRKAAETSWSQALPLWYDARDSQCRGSVVNLTPGTDYVAELNLPGQAAARSITFRTWANQRPVAKTIAVNSGSSTLNVAEGGTASGYVVYDGSGATLDGGNSAQYNVTINASYVILRGLNLKGAKQDAIRISPNVTDVIIEDNDISGWGRQRSGNFGVDMDSGIRAVCSEPTMQRVTIQRNKIHDPRYSANSWSDGHPAGPQAITISYCGGNHVIRHNEMYSSGGNYFNDVIGGEDNFTKSGFPNADTDIYGNRLSHGWDDGIEAEGANENVRIWGNYIDRTAIGVATTATSVGPVYIFRNVWNRSQMFEKVASLDQDDRQPFFKSGGTTELGHGRRYIFHNTMLQATQAGLSYGLGGGFGLGGTGAAQLIENTQSKNNIYHQWKDGKGFTYQTGSTSSFVSDMYNGHAGDTSVTNGIVGKPVYASGAGWQSESGGNYQLAANSPGFGRGVKIANFNDDAASPDVGAHQSGTDAMKFGIAGSPGSAVGGAGTTTTTGTTGTGSTGTGSTGTGTTGTGTGTTGTGTTTTPSTSTTGVSISNTTLGNFATVKMQTVTFTNSSAKTVQFIAASMSSTRYGQSNTCDAVAPGGSCSATVTYYPTNSGSDTGTFTVTSNAPNSPHVVSLSAAAIATSGSTGTGTGTGTTTTTGGDGAATTGPVSLSNGSLTFSSKAVTKTVTFTNNSSATVQFIQASISSSRFGQTNNCDAVAPGKTCKATVTYYPTNSGADSGTFTVTSTAPNSPHVVNLAAAKDAVVADSSGLARGDASLITFTGRENRK